MLPDLTGIPDCTFDPPYSTIYLSGVETPWMRTEYRNDLGLLLNPASHLHDRVGNYDSWAADNGCFAQGDRFDAEAWLAWVKRLPTEGCLFVVAPDVVGDPHATWERSIPYLPQLMQMGFPAALCAQDGIEDTEIHWDYFDALFLGGSTEWKLSQAANDVAAGGEGQGKWTHMGRVNSRKRLRIAQTFAVDSADGTFLAFGPLKNEPQLRAWLDELDAEHNPWHR